MNEFHDLDEARRWAVQSLLLARAAPPSADTLAPALEWSLEIASAGALLPPLGIVADLGHIALGAVGVTAKPADGATIAGAAEAGLEPGLLREYEDYVLGRLHADLTFQRAADAILQYQGRDRHRAVAFLLTQMSERLAFSGMTLSPAILKRLLEDPADDLLAEGEDSLRGDKLMPLLAEQYAQIIHAVRMSGNLVSGEDLFELERGTALAGFSQRLALRQVLQMAIQMARPLPARKPRTAPRARTVATQLVAEDCYPVGGFSSLSNRGTVESLLHSQLIFMERDDRPDLFDIKLVRDELLYYSRDENQFLRRHETFLFLLGPELAAARLKDAELPYQRIIMSLALLVTVVRTLIEWLSGEGLRFEFLFLDADASALGEEYELIKMLLADQIANGTVVVDRILSTAIPDRCTAAARRSYCRCLWLSTTARRVAVEGVQPASLVVESATPRVEIDGEPIAMDESPAALEQWLSAVEAIVHAWIA